MARPKKNNADYFSHDAQMRNDVKIKAVRRKYGHTGYSVWNMLLETITDSENFEYEYNDLTIELLSGDFDVETQLLKEIIDYFILLQLVQVDDENIYIKKLIDRFDGLLRKRKRDRERVIAGENPQSKGKETKEKKIKVNEKIPTIDEVKKYFEEKGYKEEVAEQAFNYYENLNWHDIIGKPIKNWKLKCVNVWFKPEHKIPAKQKMYEYIVRIDGMPQSARLRNEKIYRQDLGMYGDQVELIKIKEV